MTRAMEMLENFRKCAASRNEFPDGLPLICGLPIEVYIGDAIKLLDEENASIERVVRDAICSYEEFYPSAPNDDCERELRERADVANKWLVEHSFEPEKFTWSKEVPPCL